MKPADKFAEHGISIQIHLMLVLNGSGADPELAISLLRLDCVKSRVL